MTSTSPVNDVDKLTNEIFSILENNFLFGHTHHDKNGTYSRGKVRILSIDAGDGILAAKTLLHLQSILRRKSGDSTAHISDFFDVVAGASTGGVLAGLLFTRGRDGRPLFTAEESLEFVVDKLTTTSRRSFFRRKSSARKVLDETFGDLTLRDAAKSVLIPCYDLRSGGPFLFSRADALETEGCDFRMAGVCGATLAERAVELGSTDGKKKIVAVGGGVGMCNPTAAAITHVLNNKQEFPMCNGVEDLLVISLGNGGSDSDRVTPAALLKIAADGAADMVDQGVSMAFGEWRTSNYVRIQGYGLGIGQWGKKSEKMRNMLSIADEILGQKNVESILFKGKKVIEYTNMEKVEMFGGELIKEQERRKNCILPNVILKNSTNNNNAYSPRSSSATTLSTLSSC